MPAVYEITFMPAGRVQELCGSSGIQYDLGDGRRLDVRTTLVWCGQCGRFTEAETVEPLAEIDRKLADLNEPASGIRLTFRVRRDLIARALERRQWRERRRAPAKCIECGSTDFVALPMDQALPNPVGIGTVVVSLVGMCVVSPRRLLFTPEGDRIPTRPPPT